jgi:cell division protease FtsH
LTSKFNGYLEKGQIQKSNCLQQNRGRSFLKAGGKRRTPKVAKDIFDRPNKGPQYTFEIGNDQIFKRN